MKRVALVLTLLFGLILTACAPSVSVNGDGVALTDADGNTVFLTASARVVSCYGSFADCWLLSGGSLAGVTQDAVEEGVVSSDSVTVVGTVKNVNLEQILALSPDYVLLSADLAAHRKLEPALKTARIPYGYFRVDTFSDYKALMAQFCAVNGRADLFETHVTQVEARIERVREKMRDCSDQSFLLMRVYSTGIKAKGADNLAGVILQEFALHNIADENPFLLEDLSVEQVVSADPDYIFSLSMGDEEAAAAYLEQTLANNPAWASLTAVREGRIYSLPKELFHYKPNERWDESYEYLAKILCPEAFGA